MSGDKPAEGDRYVKRSAPDEGRVVTVTRVWTADDQGDAAVAYEWRDGRPGQISSACPLDVFHRTYRAEAGMSAREAFEAWLKKWDVGHAPHTYELLGALLNEHAHELAEQQRAWDGPSMTMGGRTMVPLDMVADLIDPEVASNG